MKLKDLADLKPASYNPRKISASAAEGLARSLAEYGDLSGIVWNSRTGNLVAGHQRVDQLKKLGAVFHAGEVRLGPEGPRFPVRVVDWNIANEKAANVTANNLHIAGVFTDDLQDLLGEIRASMGDLDFQAFNLAPLELPTMELQLGSGRPASAPTSPAGEAAPSEALASAQGPNPDDVQEAVAAGESQVRMVQLFLNTETFPVFAHMVEHLADKYGTANTTDTVMEAIRAAYQADNADAG